MSDYLFQKRRSFPFHNRKLKGNRICKSGPFIIAVFLSKNNTDEGEK